MYSEKDFVVIDGLEHVRKRAKMYVGSTDSTGIFAIFREVLENSVDEALAGHCTKIHITLHEDDSITIKDNGRGIPTTKHSKRNISLLEVIFTTIGACGCGCDEPAGHRQDRVGLGLAVVNALSEFVEVETTRKDELGWPNTYKMSFAQGRPTSKLEDGHPTFETGTTITFLPDEEIFGDAFLDEQDVEDYLDKLRKSLSIPLSIDLEY